MNIEIIKPKIFSKNKIISGVTLRNKHLFPDTGLTLSQGSTENKDLILFHRNVLADFLSTSRDKLKFQKQVHGKHIRIVNSVSNELKSDGMITNESGIFLCISIADCCAILIHDPVNNVIAAFHCGWRGAKENIVSIGLSKMITKFNSNPSDLLVYLSPCASGLYYEVGEDVASNFPLAITKINHNKYLLDLRKVIKLQLFGCDIKKENLEISDECTISDTRFHSYRRDGVQAGRMAAFIGMI